MYVPPQANYGGIKGKLPSEAEVDQHPPEVVQDKTPDSDDEERGAVDEEELNKSDSEDEVCVTRVTPTVAVVVQHILA